jgi:hypothetical protein
VVRVRRTDPDWDLADLETQMTITDLEWQDADQFVRQCREELRRYPRSPVLVTASTAVDIEASAIQRMTPEQIAEAESEFQKIQVAA